MENKAEEIVNNKSKKKRSLISSISPAVRWSLLACFLIASIFGITGGVSAFKYYGFLMTLTFILIVMVAAIIISILLTLLLAALKRLHWQSSLVLIFSLVINATLFILLIYIAPLLLFITIAVYFTVMCIKGAYKTLSKPKKILRYSLTGLFCLLALSTLMLTLWPGPVLKSGDRPDKATLALPYAELIQTHPISVSDPSLPGAYQYDEYYYAVHGQKIDPYPGQNVIPSRSVDACELVDGWNFARKAGYGFEPDALPLNARVWMPDGDGPFPLTLIVHGNHEAGDRSDDGYAYLGELLASRGIIAASVDENFLNSSSLYDLIVLSELEEENDARAYVLLEHMRQWYDWNSNPSHEFYGKVDFDNLALIGHSRGGEAAAIAAAFSGLEYYPDNGTLRFDYPFRIKSVVAIAPSHRQYDPAGLEVSLSNTNYLVLHGGHDLDVSSFMGANMYRQTDVSQGGIKAKIWIQHANHGQFNSSWLIDLPGLWGLVFNGRVVMPLEEQQQAAKVYISAFLEATLFDKVEYTALLKDFAQCAQFLPPALYFTDYADSSVTLLDDYENSFNISESPLGAVSYSAQGFDSWTQHFLPGKFWNDNRVLTLTWGGEDYAEKNAMQTPVFIMAFKPGILSAGDDLYVSLGSEKREPEEGSLSFEIKLTDSEGNSTSMNINDFGGVADHVDASIVKFPLAFMVDASEPVLQMVCIQTSCFAGLNGDIVSMEWVFDNTNINDNPQVLYADDLRIG